MTCYRCKGHQEPEEKQEKHRVSRRDFVSAAGLGAAGLVLASCSEDSPVETDIDNPAPITSARVALAKAENYDRALIRDRVQTMFDQIGGLGDVVKSGDSVALKVNLTGGSGMARRYVRAPELSYWTHPEVARAVVESLFDAGAGKVYIVEAVADDNVWALGGMVDVAADTGASLIDLNVPQPYKQFTKSAAGTSPLVYDEFHCNPLMKEVDVHASLAKMKCHYLAGVTHTIKNLVGTVPARFYHLKPTDGHRSALHGAGKAYKTRLPGVINDLLAAFPLHLGIVDGVMTTERGEGPWIKAMTPIDPGALVAGKNVVATDAVATAVQGFNPSADDYANPYNNAQNHLRIASSRGMGPYRLEDIDIVGEKLEDVVHPFRAAPIDS